MRRFTPLKPHRLLVVAMFVAGWVVFAPGCGQRPTMVEPVPRYPRLPAKNVPPFMKETIYEHTQVFRNEPFIVSGFGFVANLAGTGDSTAPTPVREYIINEMLKHRVGSPSLPGMRHVSPQRMLADPRCAIVVVEGHLPPGIRKGQTFDVFVSALPESNTTSLGGGDLYQTDLRVRGTDPRDPAGAVNVLARAEGPLFVNPAYALENNANDPAARRSLRIGVVMDGGRSLEDRPLSLRLLQPQSSTARLIERRIDQRFQKLADRTKANNTRGLAEAQDEGVVDVYVPLSFDGDWEHFIGVVTHLYLYDSPEFNTRKAIELADAAIEPDAPLLNISYCWEGLGQAALAVIRDRELMLHPSPDVAFAAARAAAFIGDVTAPNVLASIARTSGHAYQLNAIRTLAALPNSPLINQMIRPLLDSEHSLVRIEAYRMLARHGDNAVFSRNIQNRFHLDVVPSNGPPLIYATRRGGPRIALIGRRAAIDLPTTISLMNGRLTISSNNPQALTVFYRPPPVAPSGVTLDPVRVLSTPDLAELVARLGGEGFERGRGLEFNYAEIVAILSAISDARKVSAATTDGTRLSASFVLQEAPQVQDSVYTAPIIPDGTRPQADPQQIGAVE